MLLFCFAAALFVGSAQLFLVQPMVAKAVLPLLGGTPAVWNTCMVFFQCALLAGYLYAHLGAKLLGARRQALLHLPLVLISLAALPIMVTPSQSPASDAATTWWLLQLLATTAGVPFFIVSTTAPMLQRWFATTGHPSARDPYFLYAASNAGSLVALIAYPALIEPRLRLQEQTALWTVGYGALALLISACAMAVWRSRATQGVSCHTPEDDSLATAVTHRDRARWIALAFAPSSLLLGVTTYLTTDIAAVPLLWVAPLAIYLLTFVLVFARRAIVPPALIVRLLPILVLPVTMMIALATQFPPALQVFVHLLMFFVAAMACHGELARRRPPAAHLTEFYLCMSIGGALGGIFNTLAAPVAFSSVIEYPLALALACLLALPYERTWKLRQMWRDVATATIVGAVTAGLLLASHTERLQGPAMMMALFSVPALLCFRFRRQPVRFAFVAAVLVIASGAYMDAHNRVVVRDRSFFGVHRVTMDPAGERRLFVHGNTLHGGQHVGAGRSRDPLTYYHRTSPIGQLLASAAAGPRKRVGVVGLGIGTLAAYGETGQQWDFYEIDPAVERIARNPRYFTYLTESRAHLTVVIGDARLSLASASDGYDVLVLDAFSSDAIPVHLMTREALELYRRKLRPGGMLAFNISNRHLDLEPVLGDLAADSGMSALAQVGAGVNEEYKLTSHWVAMANTAADVARLAADARWQPARRDGRTVWTDDFSNVLGVIRWR